MANQYIVEYEHEPGRWGEILSDQRLYSKMEAYKAIIQSGLPRLYIRVKLNGEVVQVP